MAKQKTQQTKEMYSLSKKEISYAIAYIITPIVFVAGFGITIWLQSKGIVGSDQSRLTIDFGVITVVILCILAFLFTFEKNNLADL